MHRGGDHARGAADEAGRSGRHRGHRVDAGRCGTAHDRVRRGGGGVVNKIALGGLLTMFAAGAWLIAAPFVVRYQPAGAPWTGPARMDVTVGALVATAGFAGFFVAVAGRARA